MRFKQSEVSLIVPIIEGFPNVHERNRLIKLEILESSNETHVFSMTPKREYLHLNETTGELWFRRSKWDGSSKNEILSERFVIKLLLNSTEEASMPITLNFTPYSGVKSFCEHQMCFYEQITFNTYEDFGDNFKAKEVGKLAPKFHHRICKDYHVEYQLLNGKLNKSILQVNKYLNRW